jgi:di/tricarboxylate transporter
MEDDFYDDISSELIDEIVVSRCQECGSRNMSTDGVCLSCSLQRSSGVGRPLKIERRISSRQERSEKIIMFLGIVLILLGGPGIVSMSYLHDWLRIPAPDPAYDAYETFGSVNSFVAVLGLAITAIGIFFLVVSLVIGKGAEIAQLNEALR